MQTVLIVSLSSSLSLYYTLSHLFYLLVLSSVCLLLLLYPSVLFFHASPLIWSLPLLACAALLPASDIQTLPRVYFFDSYATLQSNGSDSRCLLVLWLSLPSAASSFLRFSFESTSDLHPRRRVFSPETAGSLKVETAALSNVSIFRFLKLKINVDSRHVACGQSLTSLSPISAVLFQLVCFYMCVLFLYYFPCELFLVHGVT